MRTTNEQSEESPLFAIPHTFAALSEIGRWSIFLTGNAMNNELFIAIPGPQVICVPGNKIYQCGSSHGAHGSLKKKSTSSIRSQPNELDSQPQGGGHEGKFVRQWV